eukprot:jgi/Tetstr1/465953/TSEL_000916.t1
MSSGASDNMRQPYCMTHPHHEGSPPSAFAPANQLAQRRLTSRSYGYASRPTQARVDALDLLDAAHCTLEPVGAADEASPTYLRRFKAKKALTSEEQVAERLSYSRGFDTAEHERSANVVDGLLAAAAKAHAAATFKRQATERDTDRDKARKDKDKAARERREHQRREADANNRDKNAGKTGDKTRD